MDQPTIDGVNTYFVSKVAAEAGLKVALSGLGSDELFFGYPSFNRVPRWTRAARALYEVPSSVRQPIARTIDRFGTVVPGVPTGELADAVRAEDPFGAAYVTERGLFTSAQRRSLHDMEPVDWADRIEHVVETTLDTASVYDAVSHAELAWYMRGQLLRDTDVMSMTHSLEVRVPFLDTKLAEYLTRSNAKSKRGGEKRLLKAAVEDDVPQEVMERDKTGFTFPFAEWLADDIRDLVDRAFDEERLAGTPLEPAECKDVKHAFDRGNVHWSRVWALVVLSLWIDEHLTTD